MPRIALYDNLKSAVLERCGNAIRFHPTLLALAGHYRFEPRPVAVARGNEKGRVERAIRYVCEAFFAGRPFADLDDLNAQAQAWCEGAAGTRHCPEDASMTVAEAFAAADLPTGVVNVVQGARDTGAALLDAGIDALMFTGSGAAGAHFRRKFADDPHVILALELGGNNPLVVWDAADAEAVAGIVVQSTFVTTGQR